MPATSNDSHTRAPSDSRLPRTPKAIASRRGSHTATDSDTARRSRRSLDTANAAVSTDATHKPGGVRGFARWLFDGSTDRPHLRF